MKYVVIHWVLAAITLFTGGSVSWLVLTNVTDSTHYGVALLAICTMLLSWFPFAVSVAEAEAETKVWLRKRRKAKRR